MQLQHPQRVDAGDLVAKTEMLVVKLEQLLVLRDASYGGRSLIDAFSLAGLPPIKMWETLQNGSYNTVYQMYVHVAYTVVNRK